MDQDRENKEEIKGISVKFYHNNLIGYDWKKLTCFYLAKGREKKEIVSLTPLASK